MSIPNRNGRIKKTFTLNIKTTEYHNLKEDITSHKDFSANVSEPINMEQEYIDVIITANFQSESHESTMTDLLKGYNERFGEEYNTCICSGRA